MDPKQVLIMEELFKLIFEVVGYLTGVGLIKLFSKGTWIELSTEIEVQHAIKFRPKSKWWQIIVKIDNKTYYDTSLATLIVVLFWISLIAISIGTAVLIKS